MSRAEKMRVYNREYKRRCAQNPTWRAAQSARSRLYYAKQIESDSTWPLRAWKTARLRAKHENIPFNILPSDLELPRVCPVFGVPFVMRGRNNPFNPSVDRIRPALGYTKGNVRVICRRANTMKQDSVSASELLAVALYMEKEGL